MKSSQWVGALVVLAVMVFAITFAMQYLGGTGSDKKGVDEEPSLARLTFLEGSRFPPGGRYPYESNKAGGHSFWFYNANEEALAIGLVGKNCSRVELAVLPPEGVGQLAALTAAQHAARAAGPASWVALLLAQERTGMTRVEASARPTILGENQSATVPAGAVGWVRLEWSPDRPGPRDLIADLWMGKKDGGATERLGVAVQRLSPLRAPREVSAGVFKAQKKPRTVWITCWSSTRPTLQISARVVTKPGKAASEPITVGQPEPLDPAQRLQLQQENNAPGRDPGGDLGGYVRTAYRVPVTLLPVSPDGKTTFPLGHFVYRVELRIDDDPGVEPVPVTLTGLVLGEVAVGEAGMNARVDMGTFGRRQGKRRMIVLESDVASLQLKVVTSRLPSYLSARFLGPPEKVGATHQTWRLQVEVLPNRASGTFPRPEEPYQDSAVYVRTVEKTPRLIRIPVAGSANDR